MTTGRPGVFSDYVVESLYAGEGNKAVGVVCAGGSGLSLEAVKVTSPSELAASIPPDGEGETLYETVSLLFENGVSTVYCVPVAPKEDLEANYLMGFSKLEEYPDIYAVLCDRDEAEILSGLKAHVMGMSARQKERLGFAAPALEDTDAVLMAKELNHERLCVCAPMGVRAGKRHGVFLAAVAAAACVTAQDPSLSLAGFAPKGITLSEQLQEERIEELIAAGVTAFETVREGIELIRMLSTHTTVDGVPDLTFRSLNTVMVIDDVLTAVRDALKLRLKRAKNNESSRGAIKAQAVVELKKKLDAGIIESFIQPVVAQSEEDPSVCLVDLAFKVCTAVNQIHIMAYVSV